MDAQPRAAARVWCERAVVQPAVGRLDAIVESERLRRDDNDDDTACDVAWADRGDALLRGGDARGFRWPRGPGHYPGRRGAAVDGALPGSGRCRSPGLGLGQQ